MSVPRTVDEIDVGELDRRRVIHPFSPGGISRSPVIVGSDGAELHTADGRRLLDFSSQLCNVNIGHQDRRVIDAIARQAAELSYVSPTYPTEPVATLADLLVGIAPEGAEKVYFTPGGSEGVEVAIQFARMATGRSKIISRYRSYHGGTFGAAAVSGGLQRLGAGPGIPDVFHAVEQYCYRCPLGKAYPGCGVSCVEDFERLIQLEGPERVAAVLVEPIAHNDGVLVPPPEYLPRLRQICDQHNVLLILDEVLTGFGRTGRWFAIEHWGVRPDILVASKGMTSGYASLGAVIVSSGVAAEIGQRLVPFGFTMGALPIAAAAATAVIGVYRDDGLIERAATLEPLLRERLESLASRHACVADVRGMGLMFGLELVVVGTNEPIVPTLALITSGGRDRLTNFREYLSSAGLIVQIRGNVVRLYPPLVISTEQIDRAIEILDRALSLLDDPHDDQAA